MSVLEDLARRLAENRVSARALVEEALARAADPAGEGARAFLSLDMAGRANMPTTSTVCAVAAGTVAPCRHPDLGQGSVRPRRRGHHRWLGHPQTAAPAAVDAPAIARLKAQGFIVLGRTNMTEFAYSGLGSTRITARRCAAMIAPPAASPADRPPVRRSRWPTAICPVGIGTDTGGSCRIPAAFNGIVGWKPTVGRVPTRGVYPLSASLDSVGPLARSVGDCAIADAIMADEPAGGLDPLPPPAIRLGVLQSLVLDDLEPPVARDFERALGRLAAAGLRLDAVAFEAVRRFPLINAKGGLGAAEAYAHHAAQIADRRDGYDPRVVNRILHGAAITAAELIDIHRQRAELVGQFHMAAAGFDALVLPTTPLVAPPLAAIASDEDYVRLNMRSLRNTIIGNFLGVCAISLPMSEAGAPPTGLMLMARGGSDRHLLRVAGSVEAALARS